MSPATPKRGPAGSGVDVAMGVEVATGVLCSRPWGGTCRVRVGVRGGFVAPAARGYERHECEEGCASNERPVSG